MSDNLVNRLRWAATLGDLTTTSARNLMEEAAARIAELENLVAYLCGQNTDHIRVALAGNPTVVDAVVARAEAALGGAKKDE